MSSQASLHSSSLKSFNRSFVVIVFFNVLHLFFSIARLGFSSESSAVARSFWRWWVLGFASPSPTPCSESRLGLSQNHQIFPAFFGDLQNHQKDPKGLLAVEKAIGCSMFPLIFPSLGDIFPETNSYAPENGWLEDYILSLWVLASMLRGAVSWFQGADVMHFNEKYAEKRNATGYSNGNDVG